MKRLALASSSLALAVALSLWTLAEPRGVFAQVYRWTDAEGIIYYSSQGVESVPPRYRDTATIIGRDRPDVPGAPAAASAPEGIARIKFTPGQPIMVTAHINGATTARLMLDTGASRSVIHPRILQAGGANFGEAQHGSIQGVTGDAEVVAVTVEKIDVSGAAFGPLLVVSHDTGFPRGDGLLGRDFLDHFTVNIDNGAGLVTLTPK